MLGQKDRVLSDNSLVNVVHFVAVNNCAFVFKISAESGTVKSKFLTLLRAYTFFPKEVYNFH